MISPHGSTFPRDAVPPDLGVVIRAERVAKRWSQQRLADKVGVTRRTMIRIELGQHVPTAHLVHRLQDALGLGPLVPAWPEPLRAEDGCYGPRVRKARRAAGVTAVRAAAAAGVSPATFSRFEAGATIRALVGEFDMYGGAIRSDDLARLLGFEDAKALDAFCDP